MNSLSLPEPLLSFEILERLINLVLKKEALRHTIRDRDFGEVRRIRTIYHTNPLFCLLTGTPGFNVVKLHNHAFGTAGYFLAEEKVGFQKALIGNPIKLLS